jgi:ribosomal protein L5
MQLCSGDIAARIAMKMMFKFPRMEVLLEEAIKIVERLKGSRGLQHQL